MTQQKLDISKEYEVIKNTALRYDATQPHQQATDEVWQFIEAYSADHPDRASHIKLAFLFSACGRWDNANSPIKLIQRILDSEPSLVNIYDHLGATPLMCAVRWGQQLSTYVLLHYGADPRMINHETHDHKNPYFVGRDGMSVVQISLTFDRYDPQLTAMLIADFKGSEIQALHAYLDTRNLIDPNQAHVELEQAVAFSREPLILKSKEELNSIPWANKSTFENQLRSFLTSRNESELSLGVRGPRPTMTF